MTTEPTSATPAQSRAVQSAMLVFEVASTIRIKRCISADSLYSRFSERLTPGGFALVVGRIVRRGSVGIFGERLVWMLGEEPTS